MSGESSSEEEISKFKEAVDEKFLTDDLYKFNNSKKKSEISPLPLPSLRNRNHETASFNPFSIKVTPEFQHHVSQHLMRILDVVIDDSKPFLKVRKFKKHQEIGIKLLCTSKGYLSSSSSKLVEKKPYKQEKERKPESDDFEKKAKEVAVTAEWVLSKRETEHWAPCTKGEVEVVKICAQVKKKKNKKKKQVKSKS